MDKYEFSIKVEQIRKLVNKDDYETAMKIADTIDWHKVRNANLLSMVAQVYEKNHEYQEAKDILLLAYERAPLGKRLLYKLTDLALKEGNVDEAEDYYREFCEVSSDDSRQYLLRYKILRAKDAPLEQMIHALERYTAEELDEKWLYELAELYHIAGDVEKCVKTCDKIMLMFGLGKYVDRAMELKVQYAPLTNYQMDLVENREKYEEKLRAVELAFSDEAENGEAFAEKSGEQTDAVEIVMDEEPIAPTTEPVYTAVYEKENLEATVKEAEAEENLAKELSRLAEETLPEPEPDHGKTKILPSIKRNEPEKELEPDSEPELPKMANHVMIEARNPENGLKMAIETLRQIQEETGVKNQVAKISGSKLNKKGILASEDKLTGKDLVIEEAGDLSEQMQKELEMLMTRDASGMRIILIDNPKQLEMLHVQNPSLASRFECIGSGEAAIVREEEPEPVPVQKDERPVRRVTPVRDQATRIPSEADRFAEEKLVPEDDEELDIDAFAQYACEYAAEIDCSITGKSMLALYERIEIMEEDGIPLTKASAEELIEEAADRAEKPSLGRKIKGLFSAKYDKAGLLILKEEHFI